MKNIENKSLNSDTLEDRMNSLFISKSEEINKKLNDSILDFNDFNKFGVKCYPIIYFNKYNDYKSKKIFTEKHLTDNLLFDEFLLYVTRFTRYSHQKKLYDNYEVPLKEFEKSLKFFAEYVDCKMVREKCSGGYVNNELVGAIYTFTKNYNQSE